jgi:hypothetical protein
MIDTRHFYRSSDADRAKNAPTREVPRVGVLVEGLSHAPEGSSLPAAPPASCVRALPAAVKTFVLAAAALFMLANMVEANKRSAILS